MAVPKKRTGASAQAHRRANWKGTVPATTTCKHCNAIIPTHTVCPECGFYKGKLVSIKGAQAEVAEVKEEKAAKVTEEKAEKPKRTRKAKAEVAEETVEVKAEETEAKTEETEEKAE